MKLASTTPLEQALGEPIACSVNGVRKLDPQLNDSVCIVGCGFMGLIMVQVFRARGVGDIVAVDTRESILALAKSLGATHAFNPRTVDVRKAVKDLTGGAGVDIGVEAAGNQQTLDLTTDLVRMEGKLEVFGFHQGEPRKVNWGYWNWMAFQVVNGHTRSGRIYVEGMKIGLEMLERGLLKMDRLVTHRYELKEIDKGFEEGSAKNENFVKAVVKF
jgi:threonine dehydrogenase-like Zn-dependent dehydrogenase